MIADKRDEKAAQEFFDSLSEVYPGGNEWTLAECMNICWCHETA